MILLNQRKTSTLIRPFEYGLPGFLSKDKECYFKITAASHDQCAARMKHSYEDLLNTLRSRELFLNKRLERESAGKPGDMDNAKATAPYERFQKDSTIAQQRFLRGLTVTCLDNCIDTWETNIHDNTSKANIDSSRENFEALAEMAYPDKAVPDSPDLVVLFTDIRQDVLDLDGTEEDAFKEIQEQDEKN